ncbi:MAG TPA: SRPBCC family protein [Candidatus Limnocylindrales bacterium]|nr:SRPBCC family protein [Candidatus Limnocylindrales bacterium]
MRGDVKTACHSKGLLTTIGLAAMVVTGAWALSGRRGSRDGTRRPGMPSLAGGRGIRVKRAITVMRSPDELYARWRNLARLPETMSHVESVTPLDDVRSRWTVRGPVGTPLTWEAELVADEPGRLIVWRSLEGSDVDNAGSVRFTPAPGDRGTEIEVVLGYAPPRGRLGAGLAALMGVDVDLQVREDLRRFKQRMETGEVAVSTAVADAPRLAGVR